MGPRKMLNLKKLQKSKLNISHYYKTNKNPHVKYEAFKKNVIKQEKCLLSHQSEFFIHKACNAITFHKKEETVRKLVGNLERSMLAVNIKFQGVTVVELQDFRRSLPN